MPISEIQCSWLGHEIEVHFYNYEMIRANLEESLLLTGCKDYGGKSSDFDVNEHSTHYYTYFPVKKSVPTLSGGVRRIFLCLLIVFLLSLERLGCKNKSLH
jgi:hypothetical protein